MRSRAAALLQRAPTRPSAVPPLLARPAVSAVRCLSSAPLAHPLSPVREPSTPGFGQPLPSTHPHLLAPGELTRGISADEYEQRRKRLMDGLEEGAVVIVASARLKYASGKIFYKFRQDSNFWYLTGFEEPDSVLVLEKISTMRGYKMTMFVRSKDNTDEIWNGARSGREGAVDVFGADDAADISVLAPRLKSILNSGASSSRPSLQPIYVDFEGVPSSSRLRPKSKTSLFDFLVPHGRSFDDADEVAALLTGTGRQIKSASREVEKLRLIKSPAEIKVLRRAADISSDAHAKVMRFCEPTAVSGRTESSLVSHFEYTTSLAGSDRPAYVPVCASGRSSLTIHYISNRLPLNDGELVVLDAGCEWGGYASDITRTFPISGKFSSAQRDLYEAVLRVQKACIELCTEEAGLSMERLHRKSVDVMRGELTRLGFQMRGGDLERTIYPHFLTHPLGIDLHDTPGFSRGENIKAGMVITIEPGIFVPPHSNFPKEFHNLSVRVEDEILVGAEHPTILSVDAPKEVADIEACCQGLLDGVK
ncbi:peptidase M24, structural domain-containing protein [Leucosporidium creatinivorum]|uniref:Peptidase M24, structural domain-containing protein n=1 Tax=Leucosporidium creatinivorum TaxID=106004 RepID=A0A1Y2E610_9BASI|nr:peptidase M24, structural domain-containing protein [Leucosporidium creatinivorum]